MPTDYREWDLGWVGGVLFILFMGWLFFGGLFEGKGTSNKVYVDCTQGGWANSPYCNGEYESQLQEESARDENYYQNVVR